MTDLTQLAREAMPEPVAKPTIETWLPEAREMAAQCWCDATTEHIDMDPVLAEVVAYKIAAWMDTGAFHARNEAYWRERAETAEACCAQMVEALEKARSRVKHWRRAGIDDETLALLDAALTAARKVRPNV